MRFTHHLLPLLLCTAGPLAAATPPIVITEDQRISVATAPAEFGVKSYGGRLQISGNTAVFLGSGTLENPLAFGVYIYVYQDGTWTFQQRILGTEADIHADFGHAIAIDGDTLAISAPGEAKGAIQAAGCVLVYTRSNGVWSFQAKLQADDAAANNYLGSSNVVVDGDTILTLAHGDMNNFGNNAGNAYFFHRQNGVWAQQADLPTSPVLRHTGPWERRPTRVALHGDLAVVGAPHDDLPGEPAAGRAFLFRRDNGVWASDGILVPNSPLEYDFFGTCVATDGETLLVGAVQSGGVPAQFGDGQVHVYQRGESGWEFEQLLTDDTPDIVDPTTRFGATLDIEGDTALVGGPGAGTDGLGSQAGSAFIFRRQEGEWKSLRRMLPDGTDNGGTSFGSAMALHGEDGILIVNKEENGSPSFDPTLNNRGVVVALGLIEPTGLPLHLITLADTSDDEVIDPVEWNALFPISRTTITVFGNLDWNRSETLDYLELEDALADPDAPLAYLDWMDYLSMSRELDTNGDLLLSRDELLRMYLPGKGKLADAFIKRLKLTPPLTIAQWLRGKGLPTLAQYDAAKGLRAQRGELAAGLDTNEDNFVSREEFAGLFPANFSIAKINAAWRAATATSKKGVAPLQITLAQFVEAPVLPKLR